MTPNLIQCEDEDPRIAALAQAAQELVEMRDRWLNPGTLTNLYNQNPSWLQNTHQKLDEAVIVACGWPHNLEDEEILERLLALNLKRAK